MKRKIDNKATCQKLEGNFLNDKIKSGSDVVKILEKLLNVQCTELSMNA